MNPRIARRCFERRYRAPAVVRRSERRRSSSASDDELGRFKARCASGSELKGREQQAQNL
jgi:hypothetical protein